MKFKVWLETEMNPNEYEIHYSFLNNIHKVTVTDKEGNKVGQANFIDKGENIKIQPGSILWVEPLHRRKGIATAIYKYIENKTGKLLISGNLTPAGKTFWSKYRPQS